MAKKRQSDFQKCPDESVGSCHIRASRKVALREGLKCHWLATFKSVTSLTESELVVVRPVSQEAEALRHGSSTRQ